MARRFLVVLAMAVSLAAVVVVVVSAEEEETPQLMEEEHTPSLVTHTDDVVEPEEDQQVRCGIGRAVLLCALLYAY